MGVVGINEYSTFFKAAGQEPHHQMQLSVISRTSIGGGSYSSAKVQFYVGRHF